MTFTPLQHLDQIKPTEDSVMAAEYSNKELATQIAAQCWCTPETETIEMDSRLAFAFAAQMEAWLDTAAEFSRNADFYRGLLDECAQHLGPEAYTADDGSISDSPIRLKIPALVQTLVA